MCCFSLSFYNFKFSFIASYYRYGVTSVPTFALKCEGNQEIVEGANIELLSNKVRVLAETEIRKLLIGAIGEYLFCKLLA